MKKRGCLLIVIILFLVLMSFNLVYASSFNDTSQSDFNQGSYNNTLHNGTAVILSGANLSGNYTSRIFDASTISRWDNFSLNRNLESKQYIYTIDNQADVWNSTNQGANWSLVKDDYNNADGNGVTASFFNSSGAYFIIYNQDIWTSQDSGVSWSKVNDDYNGAEGQNAISAAIDKNNYLYIIEGDQDVWKSTDSGVSWSKVSTDFNGGNGNVFGLIVNSSNSLIAVDNQADIWKSSDEGVTWALLKYDYNGADGNNVDGMAIDTSNVLYILDIQDVWKSTDSGISWAKVNDDFNGAGDAENGKSIVADSNNYIYIIDGGEDVFQSTDLGTTFTKVATNFNGANGIIPTMATILKTTNLTFQVRNCSLTNCGDASFIGPDRTGNTFFTNLTNNINLTGRYFQYKVYFLSQDSSITPELYNISLDYTILDNTPPQVTIISPLSRNYSVSSIDFNVSLNEAGDSCKFSLDNWATNYTMTKFNNTYFNHTKSLSDGSYTTKFSCSDIFGNVNNTETKTFSIDTTIPSLNIILPEAKTYGYNTSLALNYSISDISGVGSCWYKIVNSTNNLIIDNTTISNCQNTTFNVTRDDSYILTLYANDSLGNLNSINRSFSVSTTIAVSLEAPLDNVWLIYNSMRFNYTVNSAASINNCSLWINSTGSWRVNQTNSSVNSTGGINSFSLNLQDGSYIWNVFCSDTYSAFALNNYTLNIDSIAPLITLTQHSGAETSQTGIPLTFSVNDTNLASCWYNLSYDSGGTWVVYPGKEFVLIPNCSSTTFSVSNDYNYIIYLTANDSAGNINSVSSSFSVSTSSTPPSSPPTSGSGGGSSVSGVALKLQISNLENLIIGPGETKTMSVNVKNNGLKYLNKCKLSGGGETSSWISGSQVEGLAAGQEIVFVFTVKSPADSSGDYGATISIQCNETKASQDFIISVVENVLQGSIKDIKQNGKTLEFSYLVKDGAEENLNVNSEYWLVDENNNKLKIGNDSFAVSSNQETERNGKLDLSNLAAGRYVLVIQLNSDKGSTTLQEQVLINPTGLTGLAIFGQESGKIFSIVLMVLIAGIIAFFIIRNIIRKTGRLDKFHLIRHKFQK